MRRAGAIAVLGMASSLLLTGCIPPFPDACPAIGYISGLELDASAFADDTFIQVCAEEECSPAYGEQVGGAALWVDGSAGERSVSFPSGTPDHITVRVFDSAAVLVSDRDYAIDWTHSTDRCGGPSTTPPLTLVP